jgi:lysozyme
MKNIFCLLTSLLLISACAPSGKTFEPRIDEATAIDTPSTDLEIAPPAKSIEPRLPASTFKSLGETPEKFNRPWKNPATSIVIDAYEGNAIDWKKMTTDKRVAGIIHRSSIGTTSDSQYKARRKVAKTYGYLWGAYHLGRSGDPIAQAKFFLKTVENDPDTLLALDLENTSSPSMMNIPNAVIFMNYVMAQTGRAPVIYANDTVTKAINSALAKNALFKSSHLWYARFRNDIPNFPKGVWSTYFLWQFSSELNCSRNGACLYNVAGTSRDMDINVFYGSAAELASQWK